METGEQDRKRGETSDEREQDRKLLAENIDAGRAAGHQEMGAVAGGGHGGERTERASDLTFDVHADAGPPIGGAADTGQKSPKKTAEVLSRRTREGLGIPILTALATTAVASLVTLSCVLCPQELCGCCRDCNFWCRTSCSVFYYSCCCCRRGLPDAGAGSRWAVTGGHDDDGAGGTDAQLGRRKHGSAVFEPSVGMKESARAANRLL